MEFKILVELLRADGSIIVNKKLMKKLGVKESIVYSELLSRYKYFLNKELLTEEGFFFNTVEDLEHATTLSDYQQRVAIKRLVELGLIECYVGGMPPKRYFKIIPDVDLLLTLIAPNT